MRKFIYLLLFLFVNSLLYSQALPDISINETFKQTSLSKVIRILKNKYDVKIAYDDALVTGITIDGQFTNKSLSAFLDEILPSKGINYQVLNGKIILTPGQINIDLQTPSLFDLTVFGMIQDAQTGEMLPNALIRVAGENRGTISNKDGFFSLSQVPTDTSTIEVTYLGYKKNTVKLDPNKSKQTLRISMAENTVDLAEFTVVDLRSDNTIQYGEEISQISIDPNSLSSLPSLGELDIFRSLQLLPGISGTDETSSELSIRNSPSSQNLVLLDGFTIYRLDHFFGVFSAINPDAVRDIQVYKGGFGPKYGGRISGVVDITGKSGNFNKPEYSFGINLLSARMSINAPLNQGKGAIHFSTRRAYTDVIRSSLFKKLYKNYRENSNQVDDQGNDNSLRPNFHFYDVNLKTTYNVSKRDIASFSLYWGRDELYTDFDQITGSGASMITENTDEIAEWGNLGIGGIWSRNWSKNYYSSFQVAYSGHNFDYLFESEERNENSQVTNAYSATRLNDVSDFQINYKNELKFKERHQLDFGLNVSAITTINDVTIDEQIQLPFGEREQSGGIFALYASDELRINKKTRLNAGFRYTATNLTDNNYFGRRLGLTYQLTPSIKLKFSNGQYYQLARQVLYDDPRSNLQDGWNLACNTAFGALNSEHLIGGINYSKNGFMVDMEYYQKNVSGLVEYTVSHMFDQSMPNDTQPLVTESVGEEKIRGLDVLIQKKIGPYHGWLSYTRSKSSSIYPQINDGQSIPSRLDQRNEAKFVHVLEFQKFNVSATFLYGSGRPFFKPELNFIRDNGGTAINYEILNLNKTVERLPTYHRLDISAALKFENEDVRGDFGISILNAYNHKNIQNRRLNVSAIERAINNREEPSELYRDIVLLDFTPSIFLNLYF
ncbi:carboxypeptidase-like regulatory domain-containing protein [Roseivirga seohaensis]|uniref:carboxypeptidase-like regulatory domain-containing protein n=1 Tax=Roseivirga seohaensis TaxID=1914963 RepID=UPI003BA858FC